MNVPLLTLGCMSQDSCVNVFFHLYINSLKNKYVLNPTFVFVLMLYIHILLLDPYIQVCVRRQIASLDQWITDQLACY